MTDKMRGSRVSDKDSQGQQQRREQLWIDVYTMAYQDAINNKKHNNDLYASAAAREAVEAFDYMRKQGEQDDD